MRRFFNLHNFLGTLFIFLTVWVLSHLAISLDFLNVFEQILGDYNLTDLAFHIQEKPKKDDRIVLVNIGNLNRAEVAQQINILNQYEPAVIGMDIFFHDPKDSIGDNMLQEAIKNTKNMVLASQVVNDSIYPDDHILWGAVKSPEWLKKMPFYPKTKVVWGELKKSNKLFSDYANSGFVNVYTEGVSDFETWRKEPTHELLHTGEKEKCFGAKIIQFYDSTKMQKLLARKNDTEYINYRGNIESFTYLDVFDVFNPESYKPEDIKGKIVMMGFLGEYNNPKDWDEDKYYSPMNKIQVGRTTPDMYGVVGHANFVSMVLDENYIDEINSIYEFIMAFILCYINVALFNYMLHDKAWMPWYDGVSKFIQLLQIIMLGYLNYYLFVTHNLKIDLSIAAITLLFSGDMVELYDGFILTKYRRLKSLKRIKS